MKNLLSIIRLLLVSSILVTILLTTTPTYPSYVAVAAAHQPAQVTQPPVASAEPPGPPSTLPSAPAAPPQPVGPQPEPTPDRIPTIAPPNTPIPIDSLPTPPIPTTTTTKKKEPSTPSALITVVARPESGTTRQGDIVTVHIHSTNRGAGGADSINISVPLDPSSVQVLSFTSTDPHTWVTQNLPERLEIESGALAANGETMSATLRLLMKTTLPAEKPVFAAMPFRWSDVSDGGSGHSNAPYVSTVRDRYALTVAPDTGATGTAFTFSSVLFAAHEPVFVWYNGPDGIVSAKSALHANEDGTLTVVFDSTEVAPGTYSFVVHGFWTEFTATAPFTIQ